MTLDREQIRRDANEVIEEFAFDAPGPAIRTARHCLALLDELEQAERELRLAREEVRLRQESQIPVLPRAAAARLVKAESRLAKVPALVGALREFADDGRWEVTPQYQSDGRYRFVTPSGSVYSSPWGFARGALLAWESE